MTSDPDKRYEGFASTGSARQAELEKELAALKSACQILLDHAECQDTYGRRIAAKFELEHRDMPVYYRTRYEDLCEIAKLID